MDAHSYAVRVKNQTSFRTAPHRLFTTSTPRPTLIYRLTFNLTCKTIVQDWISHEYSTDLVAEHPCHVITNSFHHSLRKDFSDIPRMQEAIERELRHWSLPEPTHHHVIKKVVRDTMRIMKSSVEYNNFVVNVKVTHKWARTFLLETFPKMVPATDESIESLEREKVNGCGTSCSICLEELSADCVATKMPCSHVFHGECIGRWLKSSHYCPLCRYQMPKS